MCVCVYQKQVTSPASTEGDYTRAQTLGASYQWARPGPLSATQSILYHHTNCQPNENVHIAEIT